MRRLFWKQTVINWATVELVAAVVLVSCSISHAQFTGPRIEMGPVTPAIKQDILGFFMGMPRVGVDKRLREIGCQNVSQRAEDRTVYKYWMRCDINKDEHLEFWFAKGLVSGQETEVVKEIEFVFQSNDGFQQVVDQISNQFGKKHLGLSSGRTSWALGNGLLLKLDLNSSGNYEKGIPDSYWLRMESFDPLDAEKELKEFQLRNRVVKPTPKF